MQFTKLSILISFLLISAVSFGKVGTHRIAQIANNNDYEIASLDLSYDDETNEIQNVILTKYDQSQVSFPVSQLTQPHGIVLEWRKDKKGKIITDPSEKLAVISIRAKDFDPLRGGPLWIKYLSNGAGSVIGLSVTYELEKASIEYIDGKWRLIVKDTVVNNLFWKVKKFFGKVIGIKGVEVNAYDENDVKDFMLQKR